MITAKPNELTRTTQCLIATFVSVSLIVGPGAPTRAQTPASNDPPSRVGRIAMVEGDVAAHAADEASWTQSIRNDPVIEGQVIATQERSLAELEIDASTLWLDGATELQIDHLDDLHFAAVANQGEIYLDLRQLAPGETYTFQLPRGQVSITSGGRYDLVIGDTEHPTLVSVFDGRAEVTGPTLVLSVPAGHTATITGERAYLGRVGPLQQDAFIVEMMQRERPPTSDHTVAPALAGMTGAEDLAQYGAWQNVPEYGEVWVPEVDANWAPYQDGRWEYLAPWGWTWIDNAPWGFAPFHYGRWVERGDRWCWVPRDPGAHEHAGERPVYAPALVAFFGLGAAAAIGVGAATAFSHGHVGWVPLGPREAYVPPYHASDLYLRRVNAISVNDASRLNWSAERDRTLGQFTNHSAAGLVASDIFAQSRPVAGAMQQVSPGEIERLHPEFERPPLPPTAATRGVTPAVARSFGLNQGGEMHQPAVNPSAIQPGGNRGVPPPALRPATAQPRSNFPPELTPAPIRPVSRPAPEAVAPGVAAPGHVPTPAEIPRVLPERQPQATAEPPRPELPHPEQRRVEPPRIEVPHVEPQRAPLPHPEPQRFEPPRLEQPRLEPPRLEPQRVEVPRPAAPRLELQRPQQVRPEPPRAENPRPALSSGRPELRQP